MTPLSEPMEAVDGALLDQVPPGTASDNVTGMPTQMVGGPSTGPGTGLTVTTVEIKQPVAVRVYKIVVVPVATPLTIPVVAPMVAIGRFVLVHVPPGVASDSTMVVPGHKADGPLIGAGSGLTVIVMLPVIV